LVAVRQQTTISPLSRHEVLEAGAEEPVPPSWQRPWRRIGF
jgi:hypothetical protein